MRARILLAVVVGAAAFAAAPAAPDAATKGTVGYPGDESGHVGDR